MSSVTTISVSQLAGLAKQGDVDLIDVRAPVEFREVHAPMAQNVPLDSLDPVSVLKQRRKKVTDPLYVICRSGNRAEKACKQFINAGFDNVVNVEGGIQAWDELGLPVVRGQKAMSLERQVRIVAGFFVLVGALLAMLVHRYFAGLSAFVGAGLMVAGITDTCGLRMLLAKMPWNQLKRARSSCSTK